MNTFILYSPEGWESRARKK